MADDLVCPGSDIKSVHRDNVTRQVSRIFTSVDAFIIHRFLLLYVNFSSDAAFVELHLLDYSAKTCNVRGCADTRKEHFSFAFRL